MLTLSAAAHVQDALNWIHRLEELGREHTQLSLSPWPDRYEAARISRSELSRAGDRLVAHLVPAWMGAMDRLDRKMQREIESLAAQPAGQRAAEEARLAAIADDSFWNALGLQPLLETALGKSIYMGCYQARTTVDVYIPAHQKWSRLTTAWHVALKRPAPNPPPATATAIDAESPAAPGVGTAALAVLTKAQNALFRLMAEGKGGTPEGQEAQRKVMEAQRRYEASLK